MPSDTELDAIDRRILRALQAQGRITYDDLAAQVSLSPSATLRRVKRLEDSGVITGYAAQLQPERVGLGLAAYVSVRVLKQTDRPPRHPKDLFAAAVQAWPEVVDCVSLSGEYDFLLRVLVSDMAQYARFISDTLLAHPAVQDCRSSFVLDHVKRSAALAV
jgi:Lrp/AsnC family transcriptional regulator, leucine-responsive regulatory protein